jgi:hypothetical protein
MSCFCGWGEESIGCKTWENRTARSIPKRGNRCAVCGHPVDVGQTCTDFAGLDEDGGGFFFRMHQECFELMTRAADHTCGGEWAVPWPVEEAAAYAMAQGHEPFWRRWLLDYEKTWRFGPEPPDPEPKPPEWTRRGRGGMVDVMQVPDEQLAANVRQMVREKHHE